MASRRLLLFTAPLVLVALLATQRLDRYPDPWYDEGVNIQAARNLADTGQYGLDYGAQLQPFDPQLTTGPTVIVPAALVFARFGAGLAQARAVMAAYTLVAALGLLWVGWQLYGPAVGALAVFVLAGTGGYLGLIEVRSVVGEIAALAFLWWGAGVLLRAPAHGRTPWLALAGLLFGLATVTKAQFGLVAPALLLLAIWPGRRAGGLSPREAAIVVAALAAPVLLWQGVQLATLGPGGFLHNIQESEALARVSSAGPPLRKGETSLALLVSSPSALAGVTALVYSWVRLARARQAGQPACLLLPVFASLWLAWYVVFSMGWLRQAIPLAALCSLFVAAALRDVFAFSRRRLQVVAAWAVAALAVVVASPFVWGVVWNGAVLASADDTAASVTTMVDQDVRQGAAIETYEWELDVLADRPAHHPPAEVVANAVGVVELGDQPGLVAAYEAPASVSFLVDGRFSKLDGIYRHELARGHFRRVASVGAYDLYERVCC